MWRLKVFEKSKASDPVSLSQKQCIATLSNCGNLLKSDLPSIIRKSGVARLIASGTVKIVRMQQWKIRSQVLNSVMSMDAVQRLNGSGLKCKNFGLRYSPAPLERRLQKEDQWQGPSLKVCANRWNNRRYSN
uniref:Uncharacterized protein n=1 Tax=Clandestinovirus TaxID=2831644 RepID=A0A8F8PMD2_9VIRU|nr:hypothetical protein KOM_12_156 [Clandestinovirus]